MMMAMIKCAASRRSRANGRATFGGVGISRGGGAVRASCGGGVRRAVCARGGDAGGAWMRARAGGDGTRARDGTQTPIARAIGSRRGTARAAGGGVGVGVRARGVWSRALGLCGGGVCVLFTVMMSSSSSSFAY